MANTQQMDERFDGAAPYPWQSQTWERLLVRQQSQRLPHALLLHGEPGTGKEHFARALGEYLLCASPVGVARCHTCKSCLLLNQQYHPDILEIFPAEAGKVIKVDQIRALNQFLSGVSQQGGYRIVIISPAEDMNTNAANAVLKMLEEPGQNTLFILVSQLPGRLMATIRSRCQAYLLSAPEAPQAQAWLEQRLGGVEQARSALTGCTRAPLTALRLIEADQRDILSQQLELMLDVAGHRLAVCDAAQRLVKHDSLALLQTLEAWSAELIRTVMTHDRQNLRTPALTILLPPLSAAGRVEKLFEFIDRIREYRHYFRSRANPNPQLMLEELLLRWASLFKS